ncbi:hypothetical protein [Virgisporangium aurantiacum]|uniref:Uncharacterized protein n=1 Tax=Virgisporangium aurantiacum TaxID=175570 RepID=A0A8J3ZLK2_9ACTN|nr:hypothetical protein [Virgisporangium aurantiacum]GIJ63726.1 hypothetical protein Vau01_112420 [Virgisporangium aurantiacum]
MRSARLLLAVAASVGILVTGCADGAAPTSAGRTDAGTPVAGTTAAATAGGSTSVSAEDLCGYLRGQLPTLRAIGSTVGAMANLTVNLYSWYEKRGAVPTGSEIDRQTQQECPDTRAEVLTLAGMDSFATL